jgi:hypothetical protein
MSPEAIGRTIQLILAPVVMFSACSVFVGAGSITTRRWVIASER